MWRGKTVSVILPTYNEKDSIADTVNRFAELGIVDDIVVINNNAAPGTSDEVSTTQAREIVEPRQGYGAAIRRGLVEVDADLICVCEPDGTFDPADLHKLLPFTRECDFVVGSRTVSNFIWDGANMGWFLQWGNWAVAKLIEALFNTSYLSDVGCTFRVLARERVRDIVPARRGRLGIRSRDAAARDHRSCADRAGSGQLSPQGRRLVRHGRHPQGGPAGAADARHGAAHADQDAAGQARDIAVGASRRHCPVAALLPSGP